MSLSYVSHTTDSDCAAKHLFFIRLSESLSLISLSLKTYKLISFNFNMSNTEYFGIGSYQYSICLQFEGLTITCFFTNIDIGAFKLARLYSKTAQTYLQVHSLSNRVTCSCNQVI